MKVSYILFFTMIGCASASTKSTNVNSNLYGEWILRESRCEDMVVKSSVEQKVIIFKGHLTVSVRQDECQFKNTMPYTVSGNVVNAVGPGQVSCSNRGCPAEVKMVNQLGGKDSMKLECPVYEKDDTVDFYFRLENDKLVQFSKANPDDDCDLIYSKR